MLEEHLREIGDAMILHAPPDGHLPDIVAVAAPDVIVVVMARPERDALADLRRISEDNSRPIVMFVDRDDHSFMEEAIAAGIISYNVTKADFPDVAPIIMAAVASFRRHQKVVADLQRATVMLREKETINQAKRLLMRERGIDEPRAYRWLRRSAMRQGKPIAATAADLLTRKKGETGRQ